MWALFLIVLNVLISYRFVVKYIMTREIIWKDALAKWKEYKRHGLEGDHLADAVKDGMPQAELDILFPVATEKIFTEQVPYEQVLVRTKKENKRARKEERREKRKNKRKIQP